MPEQKMIPCPECRGDCLKFTWHDWSRCACRGKGSFLDRRVPSAAERAVERIMELANCYGLVDMDKIVSIIGEEEARDDVSK